MEATLEVVKEHFKNAKEVICLYNGDTINIKNSECGVIYEAALSEDYWIDVKGHRGESVLLYDSDNHNYAKIVSTIESKAEESNSKFKKIGNSIVDLLDYKNKKYGESALEPINIFTGKSLVGQRLDDKISRVKNSPKLQKNDIADIIGYLILVCKENDWEDFSEFKD